MWSRDLRHAVRVFAATPGFTLVAVLTLALGIGATTAIFSVVDGVLLRPAPVADIGRLAVVWETDRQSGTSHEPASLPDFLDYRQRSQRVDTLAAFVATEVNYAPDAGEPLRLQALAVTAELLPMLGVQPVLGRGLTTAETRPGGGDVAVISDALWARAFGRDRAAVGRTLRLDDRAVTVVGVMPPGSDFGAYQILSAADYARSFADRAAQAGVDLWLPLQATAETLPRATHPLFMVARLKTSVAAAQEEFSAVAADLERAYPENAARGIAVEPLSEVVFAPVRPALVVLLAAVGMVLVVACVNVAHLLLVRGSDRRREVAIRLALGAGRGALARQFAAEGILLALTAGAIGSALAVAGVRLLVAAAPADIPRIAEVGVDLRVLAVTFIVSVMAGVAFAMIPMVQASRVAVQGAMQNDAGRGSSAGRERSRLRSALVVSEFTLAVVLVIGAGLMVRSVWQLAHVDPGFRVQQVVKAEYQLPPSRYPGGFSRFPDFAEMHTFTQQLLNRAATLPGVESVAIAGNHPMDPGFTNSFTVVGREAEARSWPEIAVRRVTPTYFKTMAVGLVKGRVLEPGDGTKGAPVAVINEAALRRFFAGRDPVGQQIRFWGTSRTVVGVVTNERFHGLTEAPPAAVYTPLAQTPSTNGAGVLLVRTRGDLRSAAPDIRAAIHDVDSELAVFGLEPLDVTVARSVSARRFTMLVLGLLAGVALLLAAVGIHGVLSYAVSRRTREIGVRLALGADPAQVRRMVVREGMTLAVTGASIGLVASWAVTRLMTTLLFGVSPTDPLTFIFVPIALCLVAFAATYAPALRATRVDPVTALRAE